MSQYCVLLHAQCKGCGKIGHFRKDCSLKQKSTVVEEISSNSLETRNVVLAVLGSSLTLDRDPPEDGEAMTGEPTGKIKLTEEQKNLIIDECVEDRISPTILARKWNCSPRSIRTWIQKAGKQLPKKYKKPTISQNEPENNCAEQSVENIENRFEDNITSENRKLTEGLNERSVTKDPLVPLKP